MKTRITAIINSIQFRQSFKPEDQIDFLNRLSELLKHGFTLYESVEFLLSQYHLKPKHLKDDILEDLRSGKECYYILTLLKYPKSVIMQIFFAEKYSSLEENLETAAFFLKEQLNIRKNLLKTIQYPLVLLFIFISMLIVINQTIIPEFQTMFDTMQVKRSHIQVILTNIIFHLPTVLMGLLFVISLSVVIFITVMKRLSIERRLIVYRRIPIISKYYRMFKTYFITNEFALFYKNGIKLQNMIHIYRTQDEDMYLKYISKALNEHMHQGMALPDALASLNLFENDFIQYIRQGEKSGKLDIELKMYSTFILNKLKKRFLFHLKWIQPLVFCLLGFFIVTLYLVIMLPMFEMMASIQN
ncbi:competence type IV pilus assembly protein ComGB [Staphylococcus massiliensis]|uniref:competence type IV pilus assembly protein ComGB n=1 Tax=Staphylococcus massiliensis TaxID=555791 RepID=UPI001EE13E10|nr:type II secretion system F family protein [Staphylococcus massiliensis]